MNVPRISISATMASVSVNVLCVMEITLVQMALTKHIANVSMISSSVRRQENASI
jgi:hypothetical protein